MADFDVFVQVAETTIRTYRVRVNGAARRDHAETTATAALRREPATNGERFEQMRPLPTTYQILSTHSVDAAPLPVPEP